MLNINLQIQRKRINSILFLMFISNLTSFAQKIDLDTNIIHQYVSYLPTYKAKDTIILRDIKGNILKLIYTFDTLSTFVTLTPNTIDRYHIYNNKILLKIYKNHELIFRKKITKDLLKNLVKKNILENEYILYELKFKRYDKKKNIVMFNITLIVPDTDIYETFNFFIDVSNPVVARRYRVTNID